MEDNFNFESMPVQSAPLFTFDSPKGQSSYIKVIGVGGGGGNAVNHMFRQGIEGVDFIVCNTDMKALNASPVPNKIPLGNLGLGAGGKPEKAKKAATDKADDIKEVLSHNTQMLFITAGMGGGTGTGAAPVIAEIAKSIDLDNDENKKILVVAIVTRPFSFEGEDRCLQAEEGIEELRKHVDSIIIINNDKLRAFGNLTMSKAFAMADDVLLTAAKGIAEIITQEGYVSRDFQDVNTVMEHSGTALMGTGSGSGENRAHDAIEAATTSVLLDDSDIKGAKNVMLYFSFSHENEMTIDEQMEITDYVSHATGGSAKVLWGACFDDSLEDQLKVILIATGFEKTPKKPQVIKLQPLNTKPEPVHEPKKEEPQQPVHFEEPFIIHKDEAPKAEQHTEPKMEQEVPQKRVFVLEDTLPEAESQVRNAQPTANEPFPTEIDVMVDNIHIEHRDTAPAPTFEAPVAVADEPVATAAPAPKVEPAPAMHTSPARSAFANDELAAEAAERIRKIHEMLRYDPAGPDKVQSMTSRQIADDMAFAGLRSAEREASNYAINLDGSVSLKPSLHDNVD